MDLENTGIDWKDEAPLLAAMEKKNPFTVPDNYFSVLEQNIKSRCVIEEARFTNEDEFNVPTGYFESLPSQIEGRIAEETIRSLAPADGFTVPDDYFNELQERLLAKTANLEDDVEIPIKPIRSNWIRYAAAACITVILASVLIFNNEQNTFESRLSSLPDQEIINYLQIHADMGDTPLILESLSQNVNMTDMANEITDAELEEYINATL